MIVLYMKYVLFRIRTGIPLLSDDGRLVGEEIRWDLRDAAGRRLHTWRSDEEKDFNMSVLGLVQCEEEAMRVRFARKYSVRAEP